MDEKLVAHVMRELQDDSPALRARYTEIPTFMRRPHRRELTDLDIGMIGVPFDLGVTNRPGARHGPREVRNQSTLMGLMHHHSRILPFDLCRVADLGDVRIGNRYSLAEAIAEIAAFYRRVVEAGIAPLSVGGDHSNHFRCDPSLSSLIEMPPVSGVGGIEAVIGLSALPELLRLRLFRYP